MDRLQTENNSNNLNILCYPVFQINCFSMKLSLLMSFLELSFFSYGMKVRSISLLNGEGHCMWFDTGKQ